MRHLLGAAKFMSPQILVVEDESGIRQLISDALNGHDYDIVMCNNAMTAKSQLSRSTPDLAIIDWMMPQISGIDLIKSLRSKADTADLPIIMLTARSTEDDTIAGLDAGADDYITKPFSPRELLSRVQAVLRRASGRQNPNVLSHGNLKLDKNALRVTIDDKLVALGQTEFKILQFMLSNPNQVFTREQLINNAWDHNVLVEERTVDVHILRLRKALRAHGVRKVIETVRGAGYRLAT